MNSDWDIRKRSENVYAYIPVFAEPPNIWPGDGRPGIPGGKLRVYAV